jgi:hypothetical protein
MRKFCLHLALALSVLAQPVLAEIDPAAVAAKIARYWNLGAADADELRSRIVVRVNFEPDGKPTNFELIEADGPTKAATERLFQSVRRAVVRAYDDGGLPLPEAEYDSWRVIDLVFDATRSVVR